MWFEKILDLNVMYVYWELERREYKPFHHAFVLFKRY